MPKMLGDQLREVLEDTETVRADALHDINEAMTLEELEQARIRHTGKKSPLSRTMSIMGRLGSDEERRRLGATFNAVKEDIERGLAERIDELHRKELQARLEDERIDVSLPGTPYSTGYRHPLLQSVRDLLEVLRQLGYDVAEGPEVEGEKYNFDLLNIPPYHPARDIQDTFWVNDDIVLRTHTSPMQIRYMQTHQPPVRLAVPGWCFRNETEDATHADHFYQIEGLAVDEHITMGDLKGTLTEVAHRYFGPERRLRFRPSYFPFTEPSAELDISCLICGGQGCRSCGGEGWLELGGSGMVHPKVLEGVGYDSERLSGFAFGIGPSRYTMMKFGIPDLRLFREDDLRFLEQFN
jgi:phenylalanyl-tRNA synthetase alpha chain